MTESRIWIPSSAGPKLAAPKARRYVAERDKHIFYGRSAWQVRRGPRFDPMCGAVTVIPIGIKSACSTTPEYVKTVSNLIELLQLPGGWNSYNAKPISKENVTFAVELLARLMRGETPAPHVVPKVRGGVQLEWHTRGINIEIEINSPEEVSFFAEDLRSGQEPIEERLDENVLRQWVGRLSE